MPSEKPKSGKNESLKIKQITEDAVVDLALDTISIGKQALIFTNTKRGAEKTAEEISKKIKFESQNAQTAETIKELSELSNQILKALDRPTTQCMRLANCVSKGIAFHHAGLHSKQREIVEDNFRSGKIKIIASTPTLAAGVDLPAFRTIIRDLKRYGHRGMHDIPVLEYLQMSGRAGRPKFDSYGESIAIATKKGEKERIFEVYVEGEPEDIYSKLAAEPVLRTYVLSLIASNFVATREQLNEFFSKTFWAHQFSDMNKIERMIDKVLGMLEDFEFIITSQKNDFVSAADLGGEKLRATVVGKRVAELYLDPLTAFHLITCIKKGAQKEKIDAFPLLQMTCATLEMRPLLNVRTAEYDDIQERLIKETDNLLMDEPSAFEHEYDDFLNSVKTAMMFDEWIDEKDEEYLMEKYNVRPGELHYKLNNIDWILYASEELARLQQQHKAIKDISKLRVRIKYGAREELLTLLRIPDVGKVRARKLYFAGIRDIGAVKNADLMTLTQLLGKQVALNVKKAVGEDFEKMPVSEGKRKGQTALGKYQE